MVRNHSETLRIALANARTWRSEARNAPSWTWPAPSVVGALVGPAEMASYWTKRATDAEAKIKAASS